jgi:hypothetical protein
VACSSIAPKCFRSVRCNLEPPGTDGGGPGRHRGRFGDQSEVGDELAPAPKIAGEGNALQVGSGLLERCLGMFKQGGGAVQMKPAFAALRDP